MSPLSADASERCYRRIESTWVYLVNFQRRLRRSKSNEGWSRPRGVAKKGSDSGF